MVNIPISAAFRGEAFIRGMCLWIPKMWIPKGAALIRRQRLFEARCLLEEIRYMIVSSDLHHYADVTLSDLP